MTNKANNLLSLDPEDKLIEITESRTSNRSGARERPARAALDSASSDRLFVMEESMQI